MATRHWCSITNLRSQNTFPARRGTNWTPIAWSSSKDGALYRSQDVGKTWQRFDKVTPHGTLMSVGLHHGDAKQVCRGTVWRGIRHSGWRRKLA
jgi:hypothetical protein